MMITAALRRTLMKKKIRAGRNLLTVILRVVKKKTYLDEGIFLLGVRKSCEWRRERIDQLNPMPRQA
jgi:hypothetical protein